MSTASQLDLQHPPCFHGGAECRIKAGSSWQPQSQPPQLAPGQGPTPPQCSSTPLLATSVLVGTPSLGDARAGGRWKCQQRWVPSSSSSEDQHRRGLSQALLQEQNILPQAPEAGKSWARGSGPGSLLSVHVLPTHFQSHRLGREEPHCSALPWKPRGRMGLICSQMQDEYKPWVFPPRISNPSAGLSHVPFTHGASKPFLGGNCKTCPLTLVVCACREKDARLYLCCPWYSPRPGMGWSVQSCCSFTTAECRPMPGTQLSPPPCLTEADKPVPEPRQAEGCLFLFSSAGGDVWDGPIAW